MEPKQIFMLAFLLTSAVVGCTILLATLLKLDHAEDEGDQGADHHDHH